MTPGLDPQSPTWHAIERHALAQIAMLREKNDNPHTDATRTALFRGRIAAWKELLALASPVPAQTADVGSY